MQQSDSVSKLSLRPANDCGDAHMPTYQYEAMDNTGLEIKETIEAASEAEAQQLIREKGFFVTKIAEKGRGRRRRRPRRPRRRSAGKKKGKTFAIGGVSPKQLCTFTRQLSTLQDAGLPDSPQPANSRRAVEARPAQELAHRRHRRHRIGQHAVRSDGQAAQGLRQPVRQHGEGGRGRRCARSHSAAPRRVQGTGPEPQAQGAGGHDLPRRRHHRRHRHRQLHHVSGSFRSSKRSSTTSTPSCPAITDAAHRHQRLGRQLLVSHPGHSRSRIWLLHQDHQEEQNGGVHRRQDHRSKSRCWGRSSRNRSSPARRARWER